MQNLKPQRAVESDSLPHFAGAYCDWLIPSITESTLLFCFPARSRVSVPLRPLSTDIPP
jgi:hypothetical protein